MPAAGALVSFDAQLAKRQQDELQRYNGTRAVSHYAGPKVKWEDTGLYKAMVKSQEIEEELVKIRNLIRKRTDLFYEEGDDDFGAAPARQFDVKVDYYKLLEVDSFATTRDVKGAYRRLALLYHPDKNLDKTPEALSKMQEEFSRIQEAYEILNDRATRRQYDRQKFDEARAKSQGMGMGLFSQGTKAESGVWERWSGEKRRAQAAGPGDAEAAAARGRAPPSLPKAEELRVAVRISLDKALRGGMKIVEVQRNRMQRSFGGPTKARKTFHVPVSPGQADGSEHRLDGDGQWLSLTSLPGDLVFEFRHKPHGALRQLRGGGPGDLELAEPLVVRALAAQPVLSAWSPTFKGQMVLVRFRNPLAELPPSKACAVALRLGQEGLPIGGDTSARGSLLVHVSVQLDGDARLPTAGTSACAQALRRRCARGIETRHRVALELRRGFGSGSAAVRQYFAHSGEHAGSGRMALPAIAVVWEAPSGFDPVAFAEASSALGWQAGLDPERFAWGFHPGLLRARLEEGPGEAPRHDEELPEEPAGSGDEGAGSAEVAGARRAASAQVGTVAAGRGARPPRRRPEAQEFMLRFGLGPPGGFLDMGQAADGGGGSSSSRPAEPRESGADEMGDEEKELSAAIRECMCKLERAKTSWYNRKQRLYLERQEDESSLRELLEKDKQREYERIEKEMGGLREKFESDVRIEENWTKQFMMEVGGSREWKCVFKPAMVARASASRSAPAVRRIFFGATVKAQGPPDEGHWIRLEDDSWALTEAPEHGQLLQRWFGEHQQRYLDLQARIAQRRENRSQTYVDYKRKRQEVSEWEIPPGPTEDEQREIDDEECEALSHILEPFLREVKEKKARLRALRAARLAAAAKRARGMGGGGALAAGQLPAGFQLAPERRPAPASGQAALAPAGTAAVAAAPPAGEWERCKRLGDDACRQGNWTRALELYGEALEAGGAALAPRQEATLLSNRALARSKLEDWGGSLADAVAATARDASWQRGWARRSAAELRLQKSRQALASLAHGFACAGAATGQLIPLAAELEAALYAEGTDPNAPATAAERQERFRASGNQAFEGGDHGVAVLWYTRALYHRAAMEGKGEAVLLSNRSAALLRLGLPREALADALASAGVDEGWPRPLVRAGQASLALEDFKSAYQHFARARRLQAQGGAQGGGAAAAGLSSCLARMLNWDYPAAARRWARFSLDRERPPELLRVWALSDVFFDQHGAPEWCKSLSSTFFRDDVLMLAGNLADSLPSLKFALTVLKSKFRRVFYVPGNHDLWVRRVTLGSIIKGEKVKEEERTMVDSVSKLLEVLQVCDELGVEVAPAEVAAGVFVVPMFSWHDRGFMPAARRRQRAAVSDAEASIPIDGWIRWPFPGGHDDAWKFFMRMNEPALRATLMAKKTFERLSGSEAIVLTMTHFMTRPELELDWTIPGEWNYVGCDGLDEQIRAIGATVHVYGRACVGSQVTELEGMPYVHNYLGTPERHRPGMAPFCVFAGGQAMPRTQPSQDGGFNFQPTAVPEPEGLLRRRAFGGG